MFIRARAWGERTHCTVKAWWSYGGMLKVLIKSELRRRRRRRGGRIDRREGDLKFSRITPPSSYISPGKGVECL
jgi:hypothetical protein